jgi:amidase
MAPGAPRPARSAEDLDLALRVVVGPDVGEDVAWRLELPAPRADRLSDFRVAVLPAIAWQPIASEVQRALDAVVEHLSRSGARVATAQPETFGDLREHHNLYLSMIGAAMSSRTPPQAREVQAQVMKQHYVDTEFAAARLAGYRATVADWFAWHAAREAYRAAYREFFKQWDVLLAPIVLRTAFPHYPLVWPPYEASMRQTVEIDGRAVPYERQLVYPGIATLSGQPATAFPASVAADGLPVGLQAIGPYLEDRTPIHFTALLTRELGGYQAPPGYEANAL